MRGGSQGVKNKNIRSINGKPLMYFTIKQAIKSGIFNHIVISTDSKKMLNCAKSYGADGWFMRPKRFSDNYSSKIPAIRHALIKSEERYNKKFDLIVDLDVTSPLRKVEDIINAYKFFTKKADVLITGTKSRRKPFNMVEIEKNKIRKVKIAKKNLQKRDVPDF